MPFDLSKIRDNLWVGAMPDNGSDLGQVSPGLHVVVCRGEIGDPQNLKFEGASVHHVPVWDNPQPLDPVQRKLFLETALSVAGRIKNGLPTAVVCRAGMNRSCLVVGLALKMLGEKPEEIIQLLRAKRGTNSVGEFALFNKHFEAAILHDTPAGYICREPGKEALVWNGEDWEPHGLGPFGEYCRDEWPMLLKRGSTWQPYLYLFISTPLYDGSGHNTYMKSILELSQQCLPLGVQIYFSWPRGDGIARCRNRQIQEFLKSPCTHMVCVDGDIGFKPQDLINLVTCNLGVVFGAYPAKGLEWQAVFDGIKAGTIQTAEQAEKAGVRFVVNFTDESQLTGKFNSITMSDGRRYVQIKEGSTGFMCIRRDVMEKMVSAYPERAYQDDYPGPTRGTRMYDLFHMGMDPTSHSELAIDGLKKAAIATSEGGGDLASLLAAATTYEKSVKQLDSTDYLPRYLSEDYGFCRLWTKCGGKIWVYTNAHLTHTGQMTYEGSFNSQFLETKPVASPSPPPVVQNGEGVPTNGQAQQAAPVQQQVAAGQPGLREGQRSEGQAVNRPEQPSVTNGLGRSDQPSPVAP